MICSCSGFGATASSVSSVACVSLTGSMDPLSTNSRDDQQSTCDRGTNWSDLKRRGTGSITRQMRRFRFRLESVRSLRVHAESSARTLLAHEIAVGTVRAAELERAEAALTSARCGDPGTQTGPALAARQVFVERREREQRAATLAVQAQQQIVADRSGDLTVAAAERAALDRLRERRRDAHRREAGRAE